MAKKAKAFTKNAKSNASAPAPAPDPSPASDGPIEVPEYIKPVEIGPAFYMPDIDGVDNVRKFFEEKTDAQCNFAGCGIRNNPNKKTRLWENNNKLATPDVPTLDGELLDTDLFMGGGGGEDSSSKSENKITGGAASNCIHCYICGFPIDGRRGIVAEIQNTWGGQCEHVMAVAALATLCGLAGENYEYIVQLYLNTYVDDTLAGEYKKWREKLVHQGNGDVSTRQKEGGGPKGILYKWAHPGCNEIKGSHPYLLIDFHKIAQEFPGWYAELKTDAIFADDVIRWNLSCISGVNKGEPGITDGGTKSMYWRQRYLLFRAGVHNINVMKQIIKSPKLRELKKLYDEFYPVRDKDVGKQIKSKQNEFIANDDITQLTNIRLYEDGIDQGDKTRKEWINRRIIQIKNNVLKPIRDNILTISATTDTEKEKKLRTFICISQCILTQVFENKLTSVVASLPTKDQKNWSYAPASQLASAIVNKAFEEAEMDGVAKVNKKTHIKAIITLKDSYEKRLKTIPRVIKDAISGLQVKLKTTLAQVKNNLKSKKVAVKSTFKKTAGVLKTKLKGNTKAGVAKGSKVQPAYVVPKNVAAKAVKGGYRTIKRYKIKNKYLGGQIYDIPSRIFTFISTDKGLEKIIKNKCHAIYSNELEWVSNKYHKLSPLGKSRISKWFTLLLVESSETDPKYIEEYDYNFNIDYDVTNPLPLYFTISVKPIIKEKDNLSGIADTPIDIPIDIENDLFRTGENAYNLGMFMYLTVLSMNNNITEAFIKELVYAFNLQFRKRCEIDGIDLNMMGRLEETTPTEETTTTEETTKSSGDSDQNVIYVYSSTSTDRSTGRSRGRSKRNNKKDKTKRNKKKDKTKRNYRGGTGKAIIPPTDGAYEPEYYYPVMEGLIIANNIFNSNGPNFISDIILDYFSNDIGEYKIPEESVVQTKIDKTKIDKAFIDIIGVNDTSLDYEDNTEYGEIYMPNVDVGFLKDPVFSKFNGAGKGKIKKLGEKVKSKWAAAEIQEDDRDIRIFYILGMIDYLSGINIFSGHVEGGTEEDGTEDPVINYLTSDSNPISIFSEGILEGNGIAPTTPESSYYVTVKGRCTELLKNLKDEPELQGDLLSYFGKSYGTDGEGGSDESKIHNTIEEGGIPKDIHTKITNFVCNITIINVLTYPYLRCYVTYDPTFKRYMWNYDSFGIYSDGSEITNFCRAKNRRVEQIRAESHYGSKNPYTLAYEI